MLIIVYYVYTSNATPHQKNRQYIIKRKKNAIIPIGPYCLHIAIKLICLACFRYFADSSRNELEIVDIPKSQPPPAHEEYYQENRHDKLNPRYFLSWLLWRLVIPHLIDRDYFVHGNPGILVS